MRTNGYVIGMVAAASIAAAASARGAEPLAGSQPQSSLLEEIVVTAQRREAAVQDTALSISAFSDEVMQARGIQATEDLHYHVPNFYYSEPGQAGITQI